MAQLIPLQADSRAVSSCVCVNIFMYLYLFIYLFVYLSLSIYLFSVQRCTMPASDVWSLRVQVFVLQSWNHALISIHYRRLMRARGSHAHLNLTSVAKILRLNFRMMLLMLPLHCKISNCVSSLLYAQVI